MRTANLVQSEVNVFAYIYEAEAGFYCAGGRQLCARLIYPNGRGFVSSLEYKFNTFQAVHGFLPDRGSFCTAFLPQFHLDKETRSPRISFIADKKSSRATNMDGMSLVFIWKPRLRKHARLLHKKKKKLRSS